MTKREIAKNIQAIGLKLFNGEPSRYNADAAFRELCHLASTLEEEAGQKEWEPARGAEPALSSEVIA